MRHTTLIISLSAVATGAILSSCGASSTATNAYSETRQDAQINGGTVAVGNGDVVTRAVADDIPNNISKGDILTVNGAAPTAQTQTPYGGSFAYIADGIAVAVTEEGIWRAGTFDMTSHPNSGIPSASLTVTNAEYEYAYANAATGFVENAEGIDGVITFNPDGSFGGNLGSVAVTDGQINGHEMSATTNLYGTEGELGGLAGATPSNASFLAVGNFIGTDEDVAYAGGYVIDY